MSTKYRYADRKTQFIFPPSMEEWLPEDHLARFIVDIVGSLDISDIHSKYSELSRGQKAYDPEMMTALVFYCLITGILSSRKMEQATWESIPVRYITGDLHPDHDTIASFRNRMKDSLDKIFVKILLIARGMDILKLGTVSLDGTKMKANASKHKALSYEYACKLEEKLKAEIEQLMALSAAMDGSEANKAELNIPEEIRRREARLSKIESAKAEIERREKERFEKDKASYEEKMQARAEKEERTGKKPKGRAPQEPKEEISGKAQVNLTDEDSRIMPTSGKGFEQSYNAQAGVDVWSRMIVNAHVSQAPNDKEELKPSLKELKELPDVLGRVEELLGDTGFFSEENLRAAEEAGISPYIPASREEHNSYLKSKMEEPPSPPKEGAGVKERTSYKLKTEEGRKKYAQRKAVSEPVFGIIKHVMGYRSFLTRGIENVRKEWTHVCIGYNLKRLFNLFNAKKGVLSPKFKIMVQEG